MANHPHERGDVAPGAGEAKSGVDAMTQPQLLQMSLNPADVVYTPDDVARDVVDFFKPTGRILEPCKGEGAFLKYLPGADWCEIEQGRDFFAEHRHYDWIIGNQPYSIFVEFLAHSFELADNVAYLLPTNKIFQSPAVFNQIEPYGGIKAMLIYGGGNSIGMPFGFSVGVFHFQRNYRGGTFITFRDKIFPA
jgi:hypothetical protein